jgi:hypothetical protein
VLAALVPLVLVPPALVLPAPAVLVAPAEVELNASPASAPQAAMATKRAALMPAWPIRGGSGYAIRLGDATSEQPGRLGRLAASARWINLWNMPPLPRRELLSLGIPATLGHALNC